MQSSHLVHWHFFSNPLTVPFFTTREIFELDEDNDEDDPMVATDNNELPQTWQGDTNKSGV